MGSELADGPGPVLAVRRGTPARLRPLPASALPPATIGGALDALEAALATSGAGDARRLAADVMAALLEVPRFWPRGNRGSACDDALWRAAVRAAGRLAAGAPFAYAVGRAAFRHLTLAVDDRVLIPRPETELLVEHALAASGERGGVAVDVGTGSGAIALSLAREGRFSRVIATDVSLDALAVARANYARLGGTLNASVDFRHGSLLAPLAGTRVRLVVSNPPYVAHGEAAALPAAVRDWEPPVALFSADDGLAATRALIVDAGAALEAGGCLALEVDTRRAGRVAAIARADPRFAEVRVHTDLTGRERFVTARRS